MPQSISGHVLGNDRRPVNSVRVLLNGKQVAESRDNGFFSVDLPKSSKQRVALTFVANGYATNTRVFPARAGGGNIVVIWPVAYKVRFPASRDLDIELGGSRIRIPAQALASRTARTFDGVAELHFTPFDVTDPAQRAAASGDFTGRTSDGAIRRLNSFGIFNLDIYDAKGNALILQKGREIALEIAVPPRLAGRAPRRVGYFDFDIATGLWIQSGVFDYAPDTLTYNGSVQSFGGAHNLDNPQDTTCVTVQVVSWWNNTPLPNMLVYAQGAQYTSQGTTDANGFVCLLVERNSTFTVTAQGNPFGSGFWGTPQPVVLTSPNIASNASNCGDPVQCPFVGLVPADFAVGVGMSAGAALAAPSLTAPQAP